MNLAEQVLRASGSVPKPKRFLLYLEGLPEERLRARLQVLQSQQGAPDLAPMRERGWWHAGRMAQKERGGPNA